MSAHLEALDFVLLVGTLLASAIGLYFSNKNKSVESYMLGDRKQSLFPVSFSLMASCLSGLSLMGYSAEIYYQGPTYSMHFLSTLLAGPITAFTVLPVIYRLNGLSLYSYLYKRYGFSIKYFVTSVHIIHMIAYNAIVIYLPSMAVHTMLGISQYYSIFLFGSLCILYSVAGGLKAVLWTDTLQAGLMFSSLIVVAAIGTYDAGGFRQLYELVRDGGRINFDGFLNTDLSTRHTLIGILFGATLKEIYMVGVNQVQVQRALSLPSLRLGQIGYILCSVFGALFTLLASYCGAVVYASYGSCDPKLNDEIPRRDIILLHYVANRLGRIPGARGLFAAGIFSASLSTLSSAANSIAALVLQDFVRPLLNRILAHSTKRQRNQRSTLSDKNSLLVAKISTALAGSICVLAAFALDKANSRLMQATATLNAAIGVPFLASFLLGMFTNFVNTTGVIAGFIVNLSFGIYVTYAQVFVKPPLEPTMFVQFNGQCPLVFNMTLRPTEALHATSYFVPDPTIQLQQLVDEKKPFELSDISYLMLPIVQFILMIVIACSVSLVSGGHKQSVAEELTANCSGRAPRPKVSVSCEPFAQIEAKLRNQLILSPSKLDDSDKNRLSKIIVAKDSIKSVGETNGRNNKH